MELRLTTVSMKPKKKTEKLEEVRRLWVTVRQNNRLNVSERSGKRGKCDGSEISEISENTLEPHIPQYTMLLKLGNTHSHSLLISVHMVEPNGASQNYKYINAISGDIPTYVKKINKG